MVVVIPLALPPLMGGILLDLSRRPLLVPRTALRWPSDPVDRGHRAGPDVRGGAFSDCDGALCLRAIDPALLDVAATLGHSELSRFRRVAVPLAADGIRAGMLLAWLRAFGEYGATVVLAYHPFSLPVYTYNQFSGIGLPTTIAPTALAIGVAVVALCLSRVHWPGGPRPRVSPPQNRWCRSMPLSVASRLASMSTSGR